MKNIFIGIVIGLLLAGIGFFCYQHFVLTPELKAKEAAYDALKTKTDADYAKTQQQIADQLLIISAQSQKITNILANADKPNPLVAEKDKTIAQLDKALVQAKTDAERVPILTAEVAAWSQKFSLAEATHKIDMTNLNAAWQTKFDAMATIANARLSEYTEEHTLRLKSEDLVGALKKSVRSRGFWETAEAVGGVVIAGFLVYKLAHKTTTTTTTVVTK